MNMNEQEIFRKMRFDEFLAHQTIYDKKGREQRTQEYTSVFQSAFTELCEGHYEKAAIVVKKFRLFRRKWFLMLLYAEFEHYCKVNKMIMPLQDEFLVVFACSGKKRESFVQKVRDKLPKSKSAAKSYEKFAAFKRAEEEYSMYNIKNIAVCATMSAGKSTFVNALLGRDILPARNEATTAKITSVCDKDGAEKIVGYVVENGKMTEQSADVTLEILEKWNSNSGIERIYLQGDFDGIANEGFVAAIHDTPGTNNSGDTSHHDVTMKFLQNNKMDALIFVANATQLCTNDERALLAELLNKVVKPAKMPVIFILNKADELDEEKESISDIQKRYAEYLEEIGFVEPKIFPLSAKAARLLKMVKNGRAENLTAREKRDLRNIESAFDEFEKTGLPSVERYIENLFGGR